MATYNLQIERMSCGACVRHVTQALNAVPQTRAEEVRIGSARVASDREPAELLQALDTAGYPAHLVQA